MPARRSKSEKQDAAEQLRRDPYEVLGVSKNCTDHEIKSAYRKMALKYHPDKNANDPQATDMFKEVTFSFNILSDPEKRRLYDAAGFEAVEAESQELELDLSSLGAVNTVFAALFSKLGMPIKTTVSANVLEEALNGKVSIDPLILGQAISKKVEKQCAHFYSITITKDEANSGLVCRVESSNKSKFKLLYFDKEDNGGLSLLLQEDGRKMGKLKTAGMYFLGFPVYRLDQTVNSMAQAKDPESAFFKKLDGFQPCEVTKLEAGTHVFAVYGDNFFKSVNYTIEVISAVHLRQEKEDLRFIEGEIVKKRAELAKFETEYKEVITQFSEMTSRFTQEMQSIDELLKRRNEIHAAYTISPSMKLSSSKKKNRRKTLKKAKEEEEEEEDRIKKKKSGRIKKKRWYNIHLKTEKKKHC